MKNLVPRLARSPAKTGATKITVQKYYLPSGSSTQLKGVIPDIVLPSVEDFLPIGEKDLPRALAWDEVPTTFFDGKPLDSKVLTPLREASEKRQSSLEEFAYLRRYVDWFKTRQEQKLVSLNLETRESQKKADDDFQKKMKAEREELAKSDFPFKEFRLGPPPPPKVKSTKKDSDSPDIEDDAELSTDDNESYSKADIHLRESLRVLKDALALVHDKQLWVDDHAPLTAQTSARE
jgi:carboxyl-terminal processing protease